MLLVAAAATTVPASLDPSPGGVSSKEVAISPNVSVRLYLPNTTNPADKRLHIVDNYHGGAFCIESAFSPQYHSYACSLSSRANALVVSVEYRLAPEHRLPVAHDDAWEALQWALGPDADEWLVERGDVASVFLAGDSAGANLAHHATSAASKRGLRIEGLVLVHPYFWLKGGGGPEPGGGVGSDERDAHRGPAAQLDGGRHGGGDGGAAVPEGDGGGGGEGRAEGSRGRVPGGAGEERVGWGGGAGGDGGGGGLRVPSGEVGVR
ncbi:tuliposide A-converting enzyme 1, chloroplastic-like [Iris pallida]|uniref:Tuliposide A-converting enzyme 1, chloroplastic-like n=1 Tax=Iris pallida TaxID=29817 RepID=A0AAX6DU21_IRIPA|nr:tuliposide A-converting enzyme 1, chloroplastic-like [Iris pallida]